MGLISEKPLSKSLPGRERFKKIYILPSLRRAAKRAKTTGYFKDSVIG